MNALSLLSEIIAQGGKTSTAHYRGQLTFSALMRHGYLCEAGVVASLVCNDCEEAHASPVEHESGRYGYFCPSLGFVPLDRADIQATKPSVARLIEHLAETFDCKRRKTTPLRGQTWRIGAISTTAGDIALFFHPCLQDEEDARNLEQALSREMSTQWRLIVTASGTLAVAGAHTARLIDLVEMDCDTGAFRIAMRPADLVGIPQKNKGGRPRKHWDFLADTIAERAEAGAALSGLNAEARAIREQFEARYPGISVPSQSKVKRDLTNFRGAS